MSLGYLVRAFGSKSKEDKYDFLEYGSFFMGGVISGLILNDLWKKYKLPGADQPVVIRDEGKKDYNWGHIYTQGAAWSILIAGAMLKKHNLIPLSFGMLLGESWSQSSGAGKYIGGT